MRCKHEKVTITELLEFDISVDIDGDSVTNEQESTYTPLLTGIYVECHICGFSKTYPARRDYPKWVDHHIETWNKHRDRLW